MSEAANACSSLPDLIRQSILQSQHDIAMVERERGAEITRRVRPADAA